MSDPLHIALAALIILIAYLIRGVSGFGSALFSVPLLAHFLPLTFVVPLLAALDLIGSLVLSHHGWRSRQIEWTEIHRLLWPSGVGILLGIVLLKYAPERPLLFVLGVLVMGFGLRAALRVADDRRIDARWAIPAGLTGGMVDALFATGGPPFVIYLSHRIHDKSRLRATLSGLFLIEGAVRILGFALLGMFWSAEMAFALLLGLPMVGLGLWAGHHIHLGIGQAQMVMIVGGLLVVSGASILVRAVF